MVGVDPSTCSVLELTAPLRDHQRSRSRAWLPIPMATVGPMKVSLMTGESVLQEASVLQTVLQQGCREEWKPAGGQLLGPAVPEAS